MLSQNNKIAFWSLILIISSLIYYIENIIKLPIPFLRFGFSHIITLFLIFNNFSLLEILGINILKIIIGSILSGTFFSLIFYASIFSNFFSILFQYLLFYYLSKFISIYSISSAGSILNSFLLFTFLAIFIAKQINILYYYQYMYIFSFFTGLLNAFLTNLIIKKIKVKL
ncbi:MAG TPA: Gx transporter family protein [bacterium]|nr:Gx transporter family protein [bacterium]HOL47049.1 Gx transporter family protein [bacterium]HPQ17946.1 Gx transporter family protein [bacterium]